MAVDISMAIIPITNRTMQENLSPRQRCEQKEQELLSKYFGNLVEEAANERPETIGDYTEDLPLRIEAESASPTSFRHRYCAI